MLLGGLLAVAGQGRRLLLLLGLLLGLLRVGAQGRRAGGGRRMRRWHVRLHGMPWFSSGQRFWLHR